MTSFLREKFQCVHYVPHRIFTHVVMYVWYCLRVPVLQDWSIISSGSPVMPCFVRASLTQESQGVVVLGKEGVFPRDCEVVLVFSCCLLSLLACPEACEVGAGTKTEFPNREPSGL